MSFKALLPAVRDRIKTLLSLTDANVGTSYDGKPPAFSGEEYWQVHPERFGNEDDKTGRPSEQLISGVFNVTVTVTRRTGYAPQDRIGSDTLLDPSLGLYERIELLIGLSGVKGLHMDYLTLDKAGGTCSELSTTWTGGQTYSIPATQNGFYHPLVWCDSSQPMPKDLDWFFAEAGDHHGEPPTGIAIEIHFRDARRNVLIEA